MEDHPEEAAYARSGPKPPPELDAASSEELAQLIASGTIRAVTKRGLTQATCRHWNYYCRINAHGEGEQIAVYPNEHGQPVFAKIRNIGADGEGKRFFVVGDKLNPPPYGLHTLGSGGQKLIIAEGEIDAMTISQLWGNKFPVISPPLGVKSAPGMLSRYIDQISRYDQVIICFDMDEDGQHFGVEVARMLQPGKAFIAHLPRNDANEMHLAGEDKELMTAIFNAAPYRPDGVLDADEVDRELDQPIEWGSRYAHDYLTDWTYGYRTGEINVLGAGTGIGKTDWEAEEVATCIKPKEDGGSYEACAIFNYEAGAKVTLRAILGKLWSRRFHIPDPRDGSPNLYWNQDELNAARAYRREKCAKLFINDSKGASDWALIKERLRYLRYSANVRRAYVDPVAALVAGEDDQTRYIDALFAEAKQLAVELEMHLSFFSHLARPKDGPSHEEGGRVRLSQFRGSNAIGMWASFVFGLERDQQGDEDDDRGTVFRCLKDRYTGDSTGKTQVLRYDTLSGKLEPDLGGLEPERLSGSDVPPEIM